GGVDMASRSLFYAPSSALLAADLQRLLLKLGLASTLHAGPVPSGLRERAACTVTLAGGRDALARFQELVGPFLVGGRRAMLADLVAADTSAAAVRTPALIDAIPLAVCQAPLREAILKEFQSLPAGCRALGVPYPLVAGEGRKGSIRRETLRR